MTRAIVKTTLLILFGCTAIYVLLLLFPKPLFSHSYEYQNFCVYSDQVIPSEIEQVLDDVTARLSGSELYDPELKFQIFICHSKRRFFFFTRNANAGGLVNFLISPNVFIRACDIVDNEIIPPGSWLMNREDRPLSYFIAHESCHALQRHNFPFLQLTSSSQIIEGYADYIAKGKTDIIEYRNRYLNNDPKMNPANGLYEKYHLFVACYMEQKNYSFKQLAEENPSIDLLGDCLNLFQ